MPSSLFDRESAVFIHTYKRLRLEIDRGDGVYLYTRDGRRYLDMFSGLAVNALGYGHPRIVAAIEEQARKYVHLSNYYLQEPQIALAELLTRHSGYPRVFLANSGTEATEGALKIARCWGSSRGKGDILALSNAFHGRTLGALSLMDRPRYRDGFGPFPPGFAVAEFNSIAALERAVMPATAAVMLEFIQGEGGVRPVSREFVNTLKALRERHGFLIIADEVQSGLARTGEFFGFQHFNIRPDIVTMAKPIGGGLPLGAILATEEAAAVLEPGMHGTTFGGNPVACAAGIATVKEIEEKNLKQKAADMGAYFLMRLKEIKRSVPSKVREVRGLGLMLGMELSQEGEPVVAALREEGILINCTDQTVLRFLPPLIIQREHIDRLLPPLEKALRALP